MAIDGFEWALEPCISFMGQFEGAGVFLGYGKPKLVFRTPEEWVLIAEELALSNGGMIPSSTWLYANGYSNLLTMVKKHPNLFRHLEIERSTKTINQWVAYAKDLASHNNGRIPCRHVLMNQGHVGLKCALARNPLAFAGIPQEVRDAHGILVGVRINGQIQKVETESPETQVA